MRFDRLGHTCVIGLQWGDEGKGKVVDLLTEHFDASVRYSGGANAGHTVLVGREKFALHQLPSGILREGVLNIITGGTVIDPAVLLGEIASLRDRGVRVDSNRLRISDRAHVVFPYYRREDVLAEGAARGDGKIGTTARGIGPCYADKMNRHHAIRICDLYRPAKLRERLGAIVAQKNALMRSVYSSDETFDAAKLADEYMEFAGQLRPFVCDTTVLLAELAKAGKRILFEGAQGALLDIDHGTYPYVTSSSCTGGGVASGAGVSSAMLQSRIGVIKAYSTRVGSGPFPTELRDGLGDTIRERGGEYGTTTGRPRRIGWLDLVAARYAALLVAPTHLALLHLDTLSGFELVHICTAYRYGGELLNTLPADAYLLEEVEPIFESLPGWDSDLRGVRRFADLPETAKAFVRRVSAEIGAPVGLIGVGPERDQTILVEDMS